MHGKKNNSDNFFGSFWSALGNYSGLKVAGILFAILVAGGALKSCNNNSTTIDKSNDKNGNVE